MDVAEALQFVEESKQPGVLVTLFPDGRPQASVVTAVVVEGRLWISATQTRVKTHNIRRDPRVTFVVGLRPWVAIEGRARIVEDEGVPLEKLRRHYRLAAGEHPDWDDYDRAMVRDRRLVIDIEPARAYGFGAIPPRAT